MSPHSGECINQSNDCDCWTTKSQLTINELTKGTIFRVGTSIFSDQSESLETSIHPQADILIYPKSKRYKVRVSPRGSNDTMWEWQRCLLLHWTSDRLSCYPYNQILCHEEGSRTYSSMMNLRWQTPLTHTMKTRIRETTTTINRDHFSAGINVRKCRRVTNYYFKLSNCAGTNHLEGTTHVQSYVLREKGGTQVQVTEMLHL